MRNGRAYFVRKFYTQENMNLTEFKKNDKYIENGFHGITVDGRVFTGSISASFARNLGKDYIRLFKDAENPNDVFIMPSVLSEGAFKLTARNKWGNKTVSATAFFRAMMKQLGLNDGNSYRFIVPREPVEINGMTLFPIITKSAKNINLKQY